MVRNLIVIMPHMENHCELACDFQIKSCDPRTSLKEQIVERRRLLMEKLYAGKMKKFDEMLPPVLKRQIKYKQKELA